jgi:hypothetical protein
VLEAAPALVGIEVLSENQSLLGGAALQSIAAALRHGALGNLQELVMSRCIVSDGDVRGVLNALEDSGCAEWMTSMKFDECDVDAEGAHALAPFCVERLIRH